MSSSSDKINQLNISRVELAAEGIWVDDNGIRTRVEDLESEHLCFIYRSKVKYHTAVAISSLRPSDEEAEFADVPIVIAVALAEGLATDPCATMIKEEMEKRGLGLKVRKETTEQEG